MHALLPLLALLFAPMPAQEPPPPARVLQPEDLEQRRAATAALTAALQTDGEPRTALLAALQTAAERLPVGSMAHTRAAGLVANPPVGTALAAAVRDLAADLTFAPVQEAPLPDGVPGFAALDELEIRTYPAYRMVRASMRRGSFVAFRPLLSHITQREIAMTTPVQVDYDAEGARPNTMAFLYGSQDLGPLGSDGRTEVVDVPPMTVLTLGSRGYERTDRLAAMRARLEAWLAASPEWQATAPLRIMTYNSPSVGDDRRYFEVQLPIGKRVPAAAPAAPGEARRDV